jgi:hypothetical protein
MKGTTSQVNKDTPGSPNPSANHRTFHTTRHDRSSTEYHFFQREKNSPSSTEYRSLHRRPAATSRVCWLGSTPPLRALQVRYQPGYLLRQLYLLIQGPAPPASETLTREPSGTLPRTMCRQLAWGIEDRKALLLCFLSTGVGFNLTPKSVCRFCSKRMARPVIYVRWWPSFLRFPKKKETIFPSWAWASY